MTSTQNRGRGSGSRARGSVRAFTETPATVSGSNIGFYDGRVRRHSVREMDVVSGWHAPPNGQNVYTLSKLPSSTVSPISAGMIVPGATSP